MTNCEINVKPFKELEEKCYRHVENFMSLWKAEQSVEQMF